MTNYGFITGIYFRKILKTIIEVGGFSDKNVNILDFGSGRGMLKQMVAKSCESANVINYDIIKKFTDIQNWQNFKFDVMVANQVFYTFEREDLIELLTNLKKYNKDLILLVGISRQGLLNNIGKVILGELDSHYGTKLKPKQEVEILSSYMNIISQKSVWKLADVYYLNFKN